MMETGGVKKEEGERSYKDVKKEEETCESMEGVELEEATKKKKKKSKKVLSYVEVGESSRGSRKKKAEKLKTLKKKKKIKTVKKGVPEFEITIRKSYLKFLVRLLFNSFYYYTVSLLVVCEFWIFLLLCISYFRGCLRRSVSRVSLWSTRSITRR